MPVEMATSTMTAPAIETEKNADDDQDRGDGLCGATGLRDAASNGRAFKRTARREGKPKKWAAAKIREDFRRRVGVFKARSSPGIIFVHDKIGIAVIFGGRHDAEIVVASAEDDDVDHQCGGEAPAAGVSGVEGLRHFFGSRL
jgi:hypothetical protein